MEHIEQPFVFDDHDAVAVGMSLRFDEVNAVGDLLTCGEIITRAVGKLYGNDNRQPMKFDSGQFFLVEVNLHVREGAKLARVIVVLVREKDLRDLLWLIAERGDRFRITANVFTRIERAVF